MEQNSEVQYFQELIETITGEPIEMVNIGEPLLESKEIEPTKKTKEKKEKVPTHKRRPIKESTRYDKETDTYNTKPLDPEYFKKYWRSYNVVVQCDKCGRPAQKLHYARHQKSTLCKKWSQCIQDLEI